MSTRTTNYEDLYANVGYLFYSIAASDGHVREAEIGKLKDLVKREWLPLENARDEFGTDAGYYIEFSFDDAIEQHLHPDEAFDRFRTYYASDPGSIGTSERRLIMDTARAIARVFAGKNKSEVGRLAQLELLLHRE